MAEYIFLEGETSPCLTIVNDGPPPSRASVLAMCMVSHCMLSTTMLDNSPNLLYLVSVSVYTITLISSLTTDDSIWHYLTLVTWYHLAQSILKIGFALIKMVGQGEACGHSHDTSCTWWIVPRPHFLRWARSSLGLGTFSREERLPLVSRLWP